MKHISDKQRKYYFEVIVAEVMALYNVLNVAKMQDDLRLFGIEENVIAGLGVMPKRNVRYNKEQIHDFLKMFFNDGGSTRDFDTILAEEYFLSIRAHYGTIHRIDIPPPNMEKLY
tara:strand:+ start:299 stop:643 length:345 start_codon:yes stop_codon:yes gene_type:complete